MIRYILFYFLTLLFQSLWSQTSKSLDTIYANEHKNVALFFPEPIRQGITGSENFVFTYNREKQQYFGLLQATPGEDSNLLVVNQDGSIFSYIVKYKEQLSRLNYFIFKSSSIGNEKPTISVKKDKEKPKKKVHDASFYYRKFCSHLIERKQRIGRIKKRSEGVVVSVENIVFYKEELYFVIEIKNNSTLDYDVNFLNLSTKTRKKGKKKSLQRLYQKPFYTYNLPSKIKEGQTSKLVYVFSKFSLSDERRAILELNEQKGERNIQVKISHKYINHPN